MLLEIAKPVALTLCLLSLLAVFHAAFLIPASDVEQRGLDALILLSLAAGICLSSGMIFRESAQSGTNSLFRTLPVQMFCWAVCLMLAWFLAAWYLETNYVFFKDLRRI
jgi:hypothetical protein